MQLRHHVFHFPVCKRRLLDLLEAVIIDSLLLRNSKSLVVLIFRILLSVVFASCRSFPGFPPKMNRNCQSGRSASPAKTELLYILH